jgi:hypothetical protein
MSRQTGYHLSSFMLTFEDFVEHYAWMASHEGAIDYARARVREMEQDPSGLFKGLGGAVAQRLKEMKDADLRNRPRSNGSMGND